MRNGSGTLLGRLSYGLIVLLVVGLLAFPLPTLHVRAAGEPLLMTYKGDIWAWDGGAVESRTQWGYNYPPLMSPDGVSIAYKSVATVAVNAIKKFGNPGAAGELPTTIWLLDVATNNAIRIAEQPANAAVFDPNTPDNYIIRSDPTWSLDSQALAWTELTVKGSSASAYRLVTYTVATKVTRVIVKALPKSDNYEGYASIPVRWAEPGLAVMLRRIQMPKVSAAVALYDTDGKIVSTSPYIANVADIQWIIDGAQVFIAALAGADGNPNKVNWFLLSPLGGKPMPMKGVPELFSLSASDSVTIFASNATSTANWQFSSPSGDISGTIDSVGGAGNLADRLTISPDGSQIAYVSQQSVIVEDGTSQYIPIQNQDIFGVVWGPTRWRVRYEGGNG